MEQQETKIAKKDLIRKKTGYPGMEIHKSGEVEYLTFPALERLNIVTHMVTSRFGGVSTGDCASFNFSYARDTSREAVDENFRRAAGVFGTTSDAFVCSDQTHTTNIRRVEKEDAGKGVTKEKDYRDVDGLITNVPGLILGTFYADCVPLLFVDPVHHAIGCSHSGWRGTVGEMGKKTVEAMREAYGSCPEDIFAAIGPSICQDCYEVGKDVAEPFEKLFSQERYQDVSMKNILIEKVNGKYQLDLWRANEAILLGAGILKEHLSMTDICTCCNPGYLFSHRASKGKRGNLAAFLMLKQ